MDVDKILYAPTNYTVGRVGFQIYVKSMNSGRKNAGDEGRNILRRLRSSS